MPCYVIKTKPPSKAEYAEWQRAGFTGTWEQYTECKGGDRGTAIMCGEFGEHCADCMGIGEYLCDFPVGGGKTCDRSMCWEHAHEVAPEVHYCDAHYREWTRFRDGGGVAEHLRNIVAFKSEK